MAAWLPKRGRHHTQSHKVPVILVRVRGARSDYISFLPTSAPANAAVAMTADSWGMEKR